MSRIPAATAAAMFEEIIGWPYELGGSGKTPGGVIDCSGAWVRVYRAFGKSIYHGSNRQYREYCSRTGTITGPGDLQVGMAVFKCRPWADEDKGHRDYGTAPGNIYHVGCVTSVNPLRIVHATPPNAKADTKIGNWKYWGLLKEVDFANESQDSANDHPEIANDSPAQQDAPQASSVPEPGQAKVITTTSGLYLRKLPGKDGERIKQMPIGTVVTVLRVEGVWAQVRWDVRPGLHHVGWCCVGENGVDYLQFG